MDAHDATMRNADLWSSYFQDEWSRWWSPLGTTTGTHPMTAVADGTAARLANLLSLVAAGPIAWMYSANRQQVSEIRPPAETPSPRSSQTEDLAELARAI